VVVNIVSAGVLVLLLDTHLLQINLHLSMSKMRQIKQAMEDFQDVVAPASFEWTWES
jgi:hypothetical protein